MKQPANGKAAADIAAVAGTLKAATGGAAPHHALQLMRDLAGAARCDAGAGEDAGETRVVAAIEAALALAPRDPLEGMLVVQMAAVHAAAMRCLGRAAECTEHPQIEALYLREASRLLHLFVRQAEALDRRARRLGPPAEAAKADAGATEDAAGTAGQQPDGAQVLEKLLADLRARVQERKEREGAAEGDAGDGGGEAGIRTCGERGENTGPPG